MTNKIGIGVSAEFDTSGVEQKINALGQKIAQANKAQFKPVTAKSLEDIDKLVKKFDQLLKINTDLSKRMKATGQGGAGFLDVNWDAMYPDQSSRSRQMRKAFDYVAGPSFQHSQAPAPGRQQPQSPTSGTVAAGIAANTAQAGMRAAGPAGNVAANSLGTGMSAGFGAGLMGLMGGMLALGVGKLVGAAMENLEKAQQNDIGLDKLKRMLGDVNVGFSQLKTVVNAGADNLKITYDEAGRLSAQFARLGNLSGDKYTTLPGELGVGVGMSRAYGLDPSEGVGVMGRMRGIGATKDTQDSRRFALLIGETIGKSGAFAKADQVMEAMATYTETQTRNNMGVANTEGYAGMYSSMVGSGITGLDPAGAGALLGRINASLSAGGAKGEASQYFTGMVGVGMGLNPYQTRMLREGGAFATADSMFGDGGGDPAKASIYSRYKKGKKGPGGSQTFLAASLERLRQQYGDGSDELADATANHLGIGINQAMALLNLKPNEMGEMSSKFGDLTKLSGSGIGNLSKVLYGTGAERLGVATSLTSRKDVSKEDKEAIDAAMTSGDEATQKEVLAKLTAQYDQERTMGSDIRDQKNIMDNIKTNLADLVVPALNAMRAGIIMLAGGDEKLSERQIIQEVMKRDAKDRLDGIRGTFNDRLSATEEKRNAIQSEKDKLKREYNRDYGKFANDPEGYKRQMKALGDREKEAIEEQTEIRKQYTAAMDAAKKELEKNLKDLGKEKPAASTPPVTPASWRVATANQSAAESARLMRSGTGGATVGALPAAAIDGEGKLTRGYRNNNPGNLEATVPWQGMVGSDGRFAQFETPQMGYRAMGKNLLNYDKKYGLRTIRGIISRWAPPGENNTEAYIAQVSKQMGIDPDTELNMRDEKTLTQLMQSIAKHENGYSRHGADVIGDGARMAIGQGGGTPIPEGGSASAGGEKRIKFDALDINLIHQNERGERTRPAQNVAVKVRPSQPFGTTSYA